MKENILLCIFHLIFVQNLFSQIKIDTICVSFCEEKYISYTISNKSDMTCLTWLSEYDINGKSQNTLFHDYFFKAKGDFYLYSLMNETYVGDIYNRIGFSFIKKIKPNCSFIYYISLDSDLANKFVDKIVVFNDFSSYKLLIKGIPRRFYFFGDSIFVNDTTKFH